MSLSQQEFTNAGRNMLGQAQAGNQLVITRIVVGKGLASTPSDLWPLTALIDYVMDVTISSQRDLGNGILLVEGNFRSDQAPFAFDLCELGVMAYTTAPSGTGPGTGAAPSPDVPPPDTLYSVANVFTEPPDHIDPAAPTIQSFKVKLIIDRIPTGDVIVEIGPSEAVIGSNIGADTVGPGWYRDSAGNVLYFKRAVAGPRIQLTEATDHSSITIGVKTLTANLDLYVPLSYPSPPPGAATFPTITDALASVADVTIPPDKFVTVHVAAGRYTEKNILVNHPNASQIIIVGQPLVSLAVTGNITRAGSLPNLAITVNVASTSGITAGDVVQLFNAPNAQLESCGYVTTVRPTQVVIQMQIANVLPPATIAAGTGCLLILFPTQHQVALTANDTFFNFVTGNNTLKNFGLRSLAPLVGNGCIFYANGSLENVIAVGFNLGLGVNTGNVRLLPTVGANACNVGFSVGAYAGATVLAPSSAGWNKTVWSGNTIYGLWVVGGSYQSGSKTLTYVCSCASGVRCDNGYFASGVSGDPSGGVIIGYNVKGIVSVITGVFLCALDSLNAVQANTVLDCQAVQGGQIQVVHNSTASGLYNPANNTLGPDGGYISVLTGAGIAP